jgi:hypothetical protein
MRRAGKKISCFSSPVWIEPQQPPLDPRAIALCCLPRFCGAEKDGVAVFCVVSHAQALVFDTKFASTTLPWQIDGEAADDGDVFGGVVCADTALVFVEF